VRCGPDACADRAALARALLSAEPRGGWVRGIDYHASVAGDLDRDALDALRDDVPVRLQHRSGAQWILNGRAIERLDLERGPRLEGIEREPAGRPTGRLFRMDDWLRERLGGGGAPDLSALGRRLAGFGYTALTDATPTNGPEECALFERAIASGALPQALRLMGDATLPIPARPGLERGERKILLDDARLPELGALETWIAAAHAEARGVAVHCVTRGELFLALAAFETVGARAGDRIEHAAVAPPEALEQLRALGLVVVTQPHFIRERGDAYLREVDASDRPWLYRGRAFRAAGIPLAAGSDAPFGDPDPWTAMAAAVDRRSRAGACLGPAEALSPEDALGLFQRGAVAPSSTQRSERRDPIPRPRVGERADLCLLHVPWRRMRDRLDACDVRTTWIGGRAFGKDAP